MKENRVVYVSPGSPDVSSTDIIPDNFEEYYIQSGDSVWNITKSYYGLLDGGDRKVCEKKILELNPKLDINNLQINQEINIPTKDYLYKLLEVNRTAIDGRQSLEVDINGYLINMQSKFYDSLNINNDNVDYSSIESVEGYDTAKKNLKDAIAYIEKYLQMSNGDKVELSYNEEFYFSLMFKESRFDPNAVSNSDAFGYFQILPLASIDIVGSESKVGKYKIDSTQVNKLPFEWNNDEYKNNPVVNCIVGVLYLDLMRNNIDKNSLYNDFNTEDKDKLAFYAYNKGATNLSKIFSLMDPKPSNFDEFEQMIMDEMMGNLNITPVSQTYTEYNSNYFVEFQSNEMMLDIKSHDQKIGFAEGINLNHSNIIEMIEYYRIIDAIKLGKFLDRKGFLLNEHTHVVSKDDGSIYSIASKYPGVSAENIMQANKLSSPDIKPGDKLVIPIGELWVNKSEGINIKKLKQQGYSQQEIDIEINKILKEIEI